MKQSRLVLRLLPLLILPLLISGCWFTPKTSALKAVHESYRDDFVRFVLPAPGDSPSLPTNQPPFAATLDAIRKFRLKYGESSPEAAHLRVLEGMIYLQAGRPSMARLIAEDVAKAGSSLTSRTGRAGRDKLFADNFDALVTGWEEIHQYEDGIAATIAEWKKLAEVADALGEKLKAMPKNQVADPEIDQGAIYLANSAAIFYVWAYELKSEEDRTDADKADTEAKRKVWFQHGSDAIKRFLSETEIKAAADAAPVSNSTGRMRYLEWYAWLNAQLK
jgi:hypothetical protein